MSNWIPRSESQKSDMELMRHLTSGFDPKPNYKCRLEFMINHAPVNKAIKRRVRAVFVEYKPMLSF